MTRIDLLATEHELDLELQSITAWWKKHSPDYSHGGFCGEIDNNNVAKPEADKAVVMNARILWFFSTMTHHGRDDECKPLADRAYRYLVDQFEDKDYGGFFWMLDYRGTVKNTKKMGYAQAFVIYALVAYWRCSNDPESMNKALELQSLLESKTRDFQSGGYLEAFDRGWQPLGDMRLSEVDENHPKTMNNHLHILECYTELYLAAPHNAKTHKALRHVLQCYCEHFINNEKRISIYCDQDWQDQSRHYSFGHEIESSWLILKALDSLNDTELNGRYYDLALSIADICLVNGIGDLGELHDEFQFSVGLNDEKVWWNQAEAIIGFLYAYSKTGKEKYLKTFRQVWRFTKAFQVDSNNGEWLYYSSIDKSKSSPYKAGAWKAPYHNGRAMLLSHLLLQKLTQGYREAIA